MPLISEWTSNQLSAWQDADECIKPIKEALALGVGTSIEEWARLSYATKRIFESFIG